MKRPLRVHLLLVLVVLIAGPLPAFGHSRIVRVEQSGAGSSGSARLLTLHFDVAIETRFSRFQLEAENAVHDLTMVTTDARATRVQLSLPDDVKGRTVLRWNLLSSDGHREKGEQVVQVEN